MALTLVESIVVQAKKLNSDNLIEFLSIVLEELSTEQLQEMRKEALALIEDQASE